MKPGEVRRDWRYDALYVVLTTRENFVDVLILEPGSLTSELGREPEAPWTWSKSACTKDVPLEEW